MVENQDIEFKTVGIDCKGCSNNCELVKVLLSSVPKSSIINKSTFNT